MPADELASELATLSPRLEGEDELRLVDTVHSRGS